MRTGSPLTVALVQGESQEPELGVDVQPCVASSTRMALRKKSSPVRNLLGSKGDNGGYNIMEVVDSWRQCAWIEPNVDVLECGTGVCSEVCGWATSAVGC